MAGTRKWTYFFGNGKADGRGDQKELLGGKGAGLAEMTRIGLPVPAGFTISTQACEEFQLQGSWPTGLEKEVRSSLSQVERACKKKFGAANDPLLVSVRSGAARSMPGMMETILNIGLNNESVEGLATISGDRRFALDAYRRLIMMYGSTAKEIDRERFDHIFDELKATRTRPRLGYGAAQKVLDTDVNEEELETLVGLYKRLYEEECGETFPQDPLMQLKGSINAVFNSWMAEKAVTYRRVEKITNLRGTAVNVCQMVFGNMGENSGTGVCFTRDPSTGENIFYGDLLMNAQGEDVVAGVRTPLKLDELQTILPDIYDQLQAVRAMLEVHYGDMQDMEFTFERGKLYLLQTRVGKRSPVAAFKIAVDQASKSLLTNSEAKQLVKKRFLSERYARAAMKPVCSKGDAIGRIQAVDIERLFYPILDPEVSEHQLQASCIGEGIGAVPGAAWGQAVFSAREAERRAQDGTPVVLIRNETSPEDVGGMHVATGILTATGGKTSHAAVVARGWGKCCIVGCEELSVNEEQGGALINGRTIRQGDSITLDGNSGRIFGERINLVKPEAPPEFHTLLSWCDQLRRLKIRTNADTPEDAARAVELGAEGIGLCRTEHMFFDSSQPQRITAMRQMILAQDGESRRRALDLLLPFQREDFEGVFTAMNGKPVTVRLLDPPLHEFLPGDDNPDGQQAVADAINTALQAEFTHVPEWDHDRRSFLESQFISVEEVSRRVAALRESNPMLGHRGCRLCITFPEILEMQVRAIIEAVVNCQQRGITVLPEIMIPLSIDSKELAILVERTREVADSVLSERGAKLKYLVGTMIETPRAAITADRMAESAEFFSFGTNDLTQLGMGLSRDDAGRFLPHYVDKDKAAIFDADPFQSLDAEGIGQLVRLAVEKGRSTRKQIKLGVCGEHGGDPESIRLFSEIGLDYVSCSPLRVPIARLAAAQAAISRGTRTRSAKPTTGGGGGSAKKAKRSKVASGRKMKAKVKAKSKTKTKAKKKSRAESGLKTKAKTKAGTKTEVKAGKPRSKPKVKVRPSISAAMQLPKQRKVARSARVRHETVPV